MDGRRLRVPYYRDRGFVLGRGVTYAPTRARSAWRTASVVKHGRQMHVALQLPEFHIWSVPTADASQLSGAAWRWGKCSLTEKKKKYAHRRAVGRTPRRARAISMRR